VVKKVFVLRSALTARLSATDRADAGDSCRPRTPDQPGRCGGRSSPVSKTIATLVAALVTTAVFAPSVHAQARFINLSNRDVSVARYTHQPYQSQAGGLAVIVEEGWTFSGWWNIAPGHTWEGAAGHYYVEDGNGRIAWNGRNESVGFVTSSRFDVFVPKNNWGAKERELLRNGYRKVTFQEFGDGNWRIGGDAYRLTSKTFPFDFSSRSINFHNRDFPVPGQVAYITHSGEQWGANGIAWGYRDNKAWVTLSTEGAQTRPFGPRESGYYRGNVTVFYTERR
jgi:hypothetical protein